MQKNPYAILGVARQATQSEIAAAYRRLARQHHPDVSKSEIALMQDINWAYQQLSDPTTRLSHDRDIYARRRTRASSQARHGSATPANGFGSHSRSYEILGESVDRAIVGALVGLLALAMSLLLGVEATLIGAAVALVIGTWIASVPNPRLSSQHGAAIGAIIGLFSAVNFSVSLSESDSPFTALICCAPFTLVLGGSLGAMLGTLAGWIRRAGAIRIKA
jgi:curved DNA-binding protein CbpA